MRIQEIVKQTLQEISPDKDIKSIYGEYNIRFELGGSLRNGTKKRIKKVVERATEIFRQTIGKDDIVLVIEEDSNQFYDRNDTNKDYLYTLLNRDKLKRYKGPFEQTYFEADNEGIKRELVFEKLLDCDLLIGQMAQNELDLQNIILGIANLEMGFEPCIPQDIVFFSPRTTNGFNIYDDRGCDIWSSDKEKLRHIYESLNNWILDYNRPEIDEIFK
jgi:hypothetical protein